MLKYTPSGANSLCSHEAESQQSVLCAAYDTSTWWTGKFLCLPYLQWWYNDM